MKAIIFDLYDTLLKDDFFDFHTGLAYLHEALFSEECTQEDFLTFAMSFIPLYKNRDINNDEISFLRDEYLTYCDQLEVPPLSTDEELLELDFQVMNHMQKEILLPDVKPALDFLKEKGIKLYILTNSIFQDQSHKRLLKEFGLDSYFENLYSSCNIGKRKPGTEAFNYAVESIKAQNPGLTNKDIIFIGNDYDADIHGAINAGLTPLWYNAAGNPDYDSLGIKQFSSFSQLPELIQNLR